jgi:hypothetical protein
MRTFDPEKGVSHVTQRTKMLHTELNVRDFALVKKEGGEEEVVEVGQTLICRFGFK